MNSSLKIFYAWSVLVSVHFTDPDSFLHISLKNFLKKSVSQIWDLGSGAFLTPGFYSGFFDLGFDIHDTGKTSWICNSGKATKTECDGYFQC
jgi:hypothetical protein